MQTLAKKLVYTCLPALCILMLSLSSCENSLNDIQKIASKEEERPISTSNDVDVIYSDSAKVKMHMTSPLMIQLDDSKNSYEEFPKGIKAVFYEDDLSIKGTITADYAIEKDKENILDFKGHVVVTNAQGETFRSEELIYDGNKKIYYTNKPVTIDMTGGDEMKGTGANSNASMYPWHIDNSTGIFHVDEKDSPLKQ